MRLRTTIIALVALAASCISANAQALWDNPMNLHTFYVDKSDNCTIQRNAVTDYGMSSDIAKDQSALLQHAIDDLAAQGGGKLYIPKGTYLFSGVRMGSNVHIIVEEGTIFKPFWGDKINVTLLDFTSADAETGGYIENCSIRATKGRYIVDYSNIVRTPQPAVKFAMCRQVKNFSIADATIYDNFSKFCGIHMGPSSVEGSLEWEVNRPTNGQIVNCSIYGASPGYGFCQFSGARNFYFENIYAQGGITLRLEIDGSKPPYSGVFNVHARNVISENGRSAVLLLPHITHNGTVKVDGVYAKGSTTAVTVNSGHTTGVNAHIKGATKGTFANDSRIINVHATYGTKAQGTAKSLYLYRKDQLDLMHYADVFPIGKWLIGPSRSAVHDGTLGSYTVTYEGVTTEDFPFEGGEIYRVTDASLNGDAINALSMKVKDATPHLRTWGGYNGTMFKPLQ